MPSPATSEIAEMQATIAGVGCGTPGAMTEVVKMLLGVRCMVELERAYALLNQVLTGRTEGGRMLCEEEKAEIRTELAAILHPVARD